MLRDFDAARSERNRHRDPLQFRLGGETFTCLPQVPLGEAFDLADAPEPTPTDDLGSVRYLVGFIDRILIDDDRPRFAELLRRREDPITGADIVDVANGLAEEYTGGRPTSRSNGSSGGPRTSGGSTKSTGSKRRAGGSRT